jgi:hypothetical protein
MVLIGDLETERVKGWRRKGNMSIIQRSGKYQSHYTRDIQI